MEYTTKILDCTLRDGAYLLDKTFGSTNIRGMIAGLMDADIDIIETGFLQDTGVGEGKVVFRNAKEARTYIPKQKNGHMFCVLADYSRYHIENLEEYDGTSFDAVRACFFKQEREDVLEFCREIKKKGYRLFVQPVDILGYEDAELLDLIQKINEIKPYCFSIVDTFGSMYPEDLERVYSLISHNLIPTAAIGFHSHNNLQMSSALSQNFIHMIQGKRSGIVDATIMGMGRGAGNTPTELVVQYMNQKLERNYDMDALLDLMDTYMEGIRCQCSWGYDTAYFVAGCYSAHVNNVSYLKEKNSISSRGIRSILDGMDRQQRKRYDYGALEQKYLAYMASDLNDEADRQRLQAKVKGRNLLIIAPGSTSKTEAEKIKAYAAERNSVVIAVNFLPGTVFCEYIYFSNQKRYEYWKHTDGFRNCSLILASNITDPEKSSGTMIVNFSKLIKGGGEHMDNSVLMLLRLFDGMDIASLGIAGFDGYGGQSGRDYAVNDFESVGAKQNAELLNQEIEGMFTEFMKNRKSSYRIEIITSSRFGHVVEG